MLIPIFSAKSFDVQFVLHGSEKVHFKNYSGIHSGRIRQPSNDYSPPIDVGKIQAFTHLDKRAIIGLDLHVLYNQHVFTTKLILSLTYFATTDCHEDGAIALWIFDICVIFGHDRLKLGLCFRFFENGLVLGDAVHDPGLVPLRSQLQSDVALVPITRS